jgi:hypothetical protein
MDRIIFLLFCIVAFIYTAKRRETRLKKLMKKTKKRNRYSK